VQAALTGILDDGSTPSRSLPPNPRKALSVFVGETVVIDLSMFYIGGGPIDFAALNNPAVIFTLKKNTTDNPPLVSRIATSNITVGRNRVLITLTPSDTQYLQPGRYVYDISLQQGTSPVTRDLLVPLSPFVLELTVSAPGQSVTAPQPLPLTVFNLPTPPAKGSLLSSQGPGAAPKWQLGPTVPDQAKAVRYIYVRSTGSDVTGDGTTPGSAYATVARALQDAYNIGYRVYQVIDCTGIGTQLVSDAIVIPPVECSSIVLQEPGQTFEPFQYICPLTIRAMPTTAFSAGASTYSVSNLQLANGGGSSPCGFAIITMNADHGWTVNQWKHSVVYVSTTQNGGFPFSTGVIISNTHNTLTVCFDAGLDIFNLGFSILTPSAELRRTTAGAVLQALGVGSGVSLQGLRISHGVSGAQDNALTIGGLEDFRLELCDVDGIDLGGAFATNPIAIGCSFRGDGVSPFDLSVDMFDSALDMFWCFFDGISLSMSSSGFAGAQFVKCTFVGSAIASAQSGFVYSYQQCLILGSLSDGIDYAGGPLCQVTRVEISNCSGDGIKALGPGRVVLSQVGGSGNSGYGVELDDGAHVQVDSSTNVTGTLGNFIVQPLPVQTWSAFFASSPASRTSLASLSRLWDGAAGASEPSASDLVLRRNLNTSSRGAGTFYLLECGGGANQAFAWESQIEAAFPNATQVTLEVDLEIQGIQATGGPLLHRGYWSKTMAGFVREPTGAATWRLIGAAVTLATADELSGSAFFPQYSVVDVGGGVFKPRMGWNQTGSPEGNARAIMKFTIR
jgi:hypothetical protein